MMYEHYIKYEAIVLGYFLVLHCVCRHEIARRMGNKITADALVKFQNAAVVVNKKYRNFETLWDRTIRRLTI